ncbi:Retrovirus-related Pol polyprotein from transposon TNT 1-94 [Cucumis melo var. makuwa]|uniref:Retrovirus-related Pol polyprotein from transposon TNT 1-94 n=1 Tax=Cucumis melo var. makuwa TaxID=1194695 RepID=A0A5A7TIS9_CUCMM|nr:Retrovirus-related Pol polyprotein from transposon TNT 1-94 [Cucumis melo var. makuwa]TYK29357.1 Retrovirus-related Pol polyprotein from transposon TNT 1-94 [Cucumis melo var. makuwa]
MDQNKGLEENQDEFQKIVVDPSNIDEKMSDENQAVILLNSLPKKYREVKSKETSSSKHAAEISEANVTDGYDSRYDSIKVLMVSHRDIQYAWVMDLWCTFHMTPNWDFLINFQKSGGGKVLLGDNGTCDVKGTSSVHIATHDRMIKILTNVRYVPKLKRNLISLGELDRSGYTIKFKNRVMKVTKGSLVKLRKTLRNGRYCTFRIDSGVRPSGKGSDVSSDHSSLVSQTEATEQSKFDGVQSQQDRTLIDEGPPIPKLIQTKWFKPEGDNKPRYKARLVAKVLPAYKLKYRSDELKRRWLRRRISTAFSVVVFRLGFDRGCLTRESPVRGGGFSMVLGFGIKGNIWHVVLSVSWCLVDGKVRFGGNIIDCILL